MIQKVLLGGKMTIAELYNRKIELEKKVNQIDSFESDLVKVSNNIEELKNILSKEKKDVENLEKTSLQTYIHIFLGDFEKKIEKEQIELIEAKCKYDNAKYEYDMLLEKIENYRKFKDELKRIDREYEVKLELKKNKLVFYNDEFDTEFKRKESKLNYNNKQIMEIEEAINAGEIVINQLRNALTKFDSASNWGIFDMMGGGFIATMAKHTKINEGKRELDKVSHSLRNFNREINDVDEEIILNMNIEISSFLSFGDYFFDGIFMDFLVQSKISKMKSNINNGISKTSEIITKFTKERNRLEMNNEIIKSEINELIVHSKIEN